MSQYPIWQDYLVCMWIDKTYFDPVRSMLREKHGLVNARSSPLTSEMAIIFPDGRKLVYVDRETGQGIYRVDFREKDLNSPNWPTDLISFCYWSLDKLQPRIRKEDPMKVALIDAYHIVKPTHVTLGFGIGNPVDLGDLLEVN